MKPFLAPVSPHKTSHYSPHTLASLDALTPTIPRFPIQHHPYPVPLTNPFPFRAVMSAIDGWVDDVEDALSKAENSYRQITEDTTTDEKRMLLSEPKNLVFVFLFA